MYEKVNPVRVKPKLFRAKKVNRTFAGNLAINSVMLIAALFTAAPLYLAVINSFKPLEELWVFPPKFYVMNPTVANYRDIMTVLSSSAVPFLRYLFNTVLVTAVGTAGQIVFGSMCAYPLAKHKFPGHKLYFRMIFLALMFGSAVTAIPSYLVMAKLGWVDTYLSLIVPAMGGTMGVYLMKQFMEQIHDSILESARIDGASEYGIFWRIVMPSVKGGWLTLMVFAVQSLWMADNTVYVYSESLKSLNVALRQILAGGIFRAGVGAAVSVLTMLVPIAVFLISQSNVIETMSSAGVKE